MIWAHHSITQTRFKILQAWGFHRCISVSLPSDHSTIVSHATPIPWPRYTGFGGSVHPHRLQPRPPVAVSKSWRLELGILLLPPALLSISQFLIGQVTRAKFIEIQKVLYLPVVTCHHFGTQKASSHPKRPVACRANEELQDLRRRFDSWYVNASPNQQAKGIVDVLAPNMFIMLWFMVQRDVLNCFERI